MKTLILAKNFTIGLEVLEAIVWTGRLQVKRTVDCISTVLSNGDTIEVRLIGSILRGLKRDIIYIPRDIDTDYLMSIIPVLMVSEYKDYLRRYN